MRGIMQNMNVQSGKVQYTQYIMRNTVQSNKVIKKVAVGVNNCCYSSHFLRDGFKQLQHNQFTIIFLYTHVEDSCSDDLFIESFSENDENDETLCTL